MKRELAPQTADLVASAGEAAEFLKKFAHPSRLMIVCALVEGERSVRDLEDTLGIRQPGLSQQIAELREAGLIVGRKESKNMFYRLADGRVTEFIGLMYRMFCALPEKDQQGNVQ
ncbi:MULTISPECIES: metalloregulator ArsR/SmtB family transcription factor [unclassified Aminobacter]|uniref:ArsR/SmtB family transcription factor n=1 Tax=unclassified Aminobacter TaxID=2644704 RepID=UPI000464792D|nr:MULTISPECIES: metalloregulator ArsR/SmtB family transcription factor [unclassified Aminobacter]TWH26108.1 DNA-binding transcriptional ArsR family regulator [Aminobacter sp. J15]